MQADREGLFGSLLEQFARSRREIAEQQKTLAALQFGLRRDSPEALKSEGSLFVTYFMDMYREYGYRLLRQFAALPEQGRWEREESEFAWERAPFQQFQERGWTRECKQQVGEAYKNYYFAEKGSAKTALYKEFLQFYRKNKYSSFFKEGESIVYFIGSLFCEYSLS